VFVVTYLAKKLQKKAGGGFFNFSILRHLHNRERLSAQRKGLFEFCECVLCETSKKGQKVKGEQKCQTRKMFQKNWLM
jgi:hypothetical protein